MLSRRRRRRRRRLLRRQQSFRQISPCCLLYLTQARVWKFEPRQPWGPSSTPAYSPILLHPIYSCTDDDDDAQETCGVNEMLLLLLHSFRACAKKWACPWCGEVGGCRARAHINPGRCLESFPRAQRMKTPPRSAVIRLPPSHSPVLLITATFTDASKTATDSTKRREGRKEDDATGLWQPKRRCSREVFWGGGRRRRRRRARESERLSAHPTSSSSCRDAGE